MKARHPALPSGVSRLWLAGSRLNGTGLSPRPLRLVSGLRRKSPLERAPPGRASAEREQTAGGAVLTLPPTGPRLGGRRGVPPLQGAVRGGDPQGERTVRRACLPPTPPGGQLAAFGGCCWVEWRVGQWPVLQPPPPCHSTTAGPAARSSAASAPPGTPPSPSSASRRRCVCASPATSSSTSESPAPPAARAPRSPASVRQARPGRGWPCPLPASAARTQGGARRAPRAWGCQPVAGVCCLLTVYFGSKTSRKDTGVTGEGCPLPGPLVLTLTGAPSACVFTHVFGPGPSCACPRRGALCSGAHARR